MTRRLLLWLLPLALLTGANAPCAVMPEVRMLIDVSGSMRQNDPQNLRVPALRLVNELLPPGASAGVWLFADTVEVLSPPGKVDAKWKIRTGARLDRIHSRGALTDIEQALTAASVGWDTPAEDGIRHLILLTDGLVDVANSPEQSAASRARIVSEQIARLKALHVRIHAIALSDRVDTELMRLLTAQTGGWLETARDADALQRIFLHMLEQTAAPTTVPLDGNRFVIDAQVSEFTLLAFRDKTAATVLIAPDGKAISAKRHPEGVAWRTEAGYDLVTLAKPQPGQWQLNGVVDPDNRVVVVTDLGIALDPFPNALRSGETQRIEIWLTDHRQPVTRRDLLQLLTAKATLTAIAETAPASAAAEHHPAPDPAPTHHAASPTPPHGSADRAAPHPNAQPHPSAPLHPSAPQAAAPAAPDSSRPLDFPLALNEATGHFGADFVTQAQAPGSYRLDLTLDGGTFQRQTVKRFKIAGAPLSIRYAQRQPADALPAALIATLDGEPDLIDLGTLSGYLLMRGPAGHDAAIEISKPSAFPATVTIPIAMPGEYHLEGRLTARDASDRLVDFKPEPENFLFAFAAPSSATADTAPASAPATPAWSWLELGLFLLIGNALLGAMLGVTWWLAHRSSQRSVANPAAQTATDSA